MKSWTWTVALLHGINCPLRQTKGGGSAASEPPPMRLAMFGRSLNSVSDIFNSLLIVNNWFGLSTSNFWTVASRRILPESSAPTWPEHRIPATGAVDLHRIAERRAELAA